MEKELEKKVVEWVSGAGNKIVVEIALVEETTNNGWDVEIDTGRVSIVTRATLDGVEQRGFVPGARIKGASEAGIEYAIGRIGVTTDNASKIEAAKGELMSHPAWVAQEEKNAAAKAEGAEYEAHYASVKRMQDRGF